MMVEEYLGKGWYCNNLKIFWMSQFDQDCITYTQEGRILQLEYAAKAVETA